MIALMRYDTEGPAEDTAGFLAKAIEVHRANEIPATFFCTGKALENRAGEFRDFMAEIADDELFDVQDHSYSHIGLCYEAGKPVEELAEDYRKSFAAHQQVLGRLPIGVSICGTSGRDGNGLPGFDATEKSREEFEMIVGLGVRMINTRLSGLDESADFCNYARLGHPEVMGYVSGNSDTSWFFNKDYKDAMAAMTQKIHQRSDEGKHMCVMFHDWCAWKCAPDKSLDHVKILADTLRSRSYELRSHMQCYKDTPLWAEGN